MSHPFAALTPDLVLDAVESIGYLSDARVLALSGGRVMAAGSARDVLQPATLERIRAGRIAKGDVLTVADLTLPSGVTTEIDPTTPIVTAALTRAAIVAARAAAKAEEAAAAGA